LAGSSKDPELQRIAALLDIQRERSLIPTREDFLMESLTTREGHHLFLYPFEGRAVHEGLAALLAYRLSQRAPRTLTFAVNDYGLELLSSESLFPLPSWEQWFSIDNLTADILASLNAAELSKRRFREIARIAGLTFEGFPGQWKSGRQLQISSGLLFDVFQKYDPENLLLRLAETEVLNRELHASRLAMALQRLVTSRIILKTPPGPTPLAYPLLADRLRANLSSEELADRITRMEKEMEKR
jgi:ATP-dependent Lhr-like helicase